MIKSGLRLSKPRLYDVSLFVQRPEGVAEQVCGVVFLFELNESVPVLAETGPSFFWTLAATEELRSDVKDYRLRWEQRIGYVR